MAHLTLAGMSDDGKRLLLVDDAGQQHTLAVDATLRAALRGEHARIGQLEIQMESALRPRDIQARIRAGETPEAVAQAAQTSVDRIMAFAAPVMAERAHVAERAQLSSVRRRSGDTGARTLGEAVAAQLRSLNVDPGTVEWDAWRREDGRWTLTGAYAAGGRSGTATFSFDARGNYVTTDDDDARWLVGDHPAEAAAPAVSDELSAVRQRRLSAVRPGEQPLGEDALELVTGAEDSTASETTLDLGDAEQPIEAYLDAETHEPQASTPPATEPVETPATEEAGSREPEAPEEQPAARRAGRKRGRASVPSWDEIMFGGGGRHD